MREYIQRFSFRNTKRVLDPFCGMGTTMVECKKRGIPSTGIEVNPLAHFAAQVRADWTPDLGGLVNRASEIAASATQEFESQGLEDDALPLFQRWPARRGQLRSLVLGLRS